jgi:hypothetical protein
MSAKIETLRPDHSAITGYVDELREDRVWGWAWDRRSPSLRVEIQVWIGDNPVATALADRPRPDLKANGVGDGQHAFEIALPEATTETVSLPIRILAKAPGGELIELERRPPAPLPEAAGQPIDAALRRIFDELEHVRSAQRVLGKAAHATLGDLRKLSGVEQRPPVKTEPSADGATAERLAAIEAVLMRVDASLADLAHKVEAAAKPGESGRIPAWLYAAIAAAAAVLATAFVMLGLTR